LYSLEINPDFVYKDIRIEIYDILGRKVYSQNLKNSQTMDLSGLGKVQGIYFVVILPDNIVMPLHF